MSTEMKKGNVYQRLLTARVKFLEANVQKTGKNIHLSFKYFELDDIVPTAMRIFNEVGLIPIVNFTQDIAEMTVVNVDDPKDTVMFVAPFNQISPIVSSTGKNATNEMQALGSSITYMRRYLYMMVLDICESDMIDANLGGDTPPTSPSKQTAPNSTPAHSASATPVQNATPASTTRREAPPTPEQRGRIKLSLAGCTEPAPEMQVQTLKNALKRLLVLDPGMRDAVDKITIRTNRFTNMTAGDCDSLIKRVNRKIQELEGTLASAC